ncbi:radical SAM protein [Psychrilyobacter sp.]|uniref:radical SAM protein n=1 Tax=Psychrilyobacter sp. TaxID=2586924 RepID=UPI003016E7AE
MESLTIMLTEKCNCNCSYCYQDVFRRKNNFEKKNDWGNENLDYLIEVLKKISILHFFGGEPLLKEDIIFKIDRLLEENKIKKPVYVFSTNLTLLSKKFKIFLKKLKDEGHKFKFITSIDGPKYIHDKNRKLVSNSSSYDLIKHNYNYLISNNYTIDSIVSIYNQEHLKNKISILDTIIYISENFEQTENIQINCEYFVDHLKMDKKEFRKKYLRTLLLIFKQFQEKKIEVEKCSKFIKSILEEIIYSLKMTSNQEYLCVSKLSRKTIFPNGNIYTCPEEYYLKVEPEINLFEINGDKKISFKQNEQNSKFFYGELECTKCKYNTICHFCPLEINTLEECKYKQKYYFLIFSSLKKIFKDEETFLFFKNIIKINAKDLKYLYLYLLKN